MANNLNHSFRIHTNRMNSLMEEPTDCSSGSGGSGGGGIGGGSGSRSRYMDASDPFDDDNMDTDSITAAGMWIVEIAFWHKSQF